MDDPSLGVWVKPHRAFHHVVVARFVDHILLFEVEYPSFAPRLDIAACSDIASELPLKFLFRRVRDRVDEGVVPTPVEVAVVAGNEKRVLLRRVQDGFYQIDRLVNDPFDAIYLELTLRILLDLRVGVSRPNIRGILMWECRDLVVFPDVRKVIAVHAGGGRRSERSLAGEPGSGGADGETMLSLDLVILLECVSQAEHLPEAESINDDIQVVLWKIRYRRVGFTVSREVIVESGLQLLELLFQPLRGRLLAPDHFGTKRVRVIPDSPKTLRDARPEVVDEQVKVVSRPE